MDAGIEDEDEAKADPERDILGKGDEERRERDIRENARKVKVESKGGSLKYQREEM